MKAFLKILYYHFSLYRSWAMLQNKIRFFWHDLFLINPHRLLFIYFLSSRYLQELGLFPSPGFLGISVDWFTAKPWLSFHSHHPSLLKGYSVLAVFSSYIRTYPEKWFHHIFWTHKIAYKKLHKTIIILSFVSYK